MLSHLRRFSRSDFHFGESIRYHPVDYHFGRAGLEEARKRRHAVRCQMKLEMALMERQEILRKTLMELKVGISSLGCAGTDLEYFDLKFLIFLVPQVFKKQHDTWMETLSTIIESQVQRSSKCCQNG